MTIGQIKQSLGSLLEDAGDAETFLENNPESQFARRTYIRSIFSCIEGTISILKDVCLKAKPQEGKRYISIEEFVLLKEASYELGNNGKAKTTTKFLKLTDNIKFTFNILNRLFNSEIDLKLGKKEWSNLLESIEVRNRITHPKNSNSFTITDEEITKCKDTISWFNDLSHQTFLSFVKSSSKNK
ncbi:hypothetical protein [Sphingobacterium sp. BIGb0116]|uniref:hypothetical protein n=1 Tax=Sphingobacterium sp. BIGb0116 TaxID=2940619 RepID=UPI0021681B01|nr:hypothetical protein [Sphingobacterium sp. BIGb0116]MCS4168521.1 hypothetical protein [Sphingobacterium sp. BIGb0116]